MSLTELARVLPPPTQPLGAVTPAAWERVEEEFGAALPPDYKEFITTWGTGVLDNFIWPFSPLHKNRRLNLFDRVPKQAQALRSAGEEKLPFAIYPDRGGLLVWGISDGNDDLYWLTEGPPTDWIVVVNSRWDQRWESFPVTMTGFLTGLLTGRLRCSFFPDDWPGFDPKYEPLD